VRAILTYHSVDPSGSPVSVAEETFARHVRFLAAGDVRVVPLGDLTGGGDAEDAVALTFDDGFANFATTAWPLLRGAGLPATVYLVTEHVGGDNSWGGRAQPGIPELPLMDWDAVGRLAEEGVDFGAHSRTHPHLPGLDAARLEDEVLGCRERIAKATGRAPSSFCYPYGDVDERAVAAVRAAYATACTTELRWLRPGDDAHRLPRLDAFYLQAPGRLEAYGSRPFARHVTFRALLRRVRAGARRALGGSAAS
jgi:peptidoglycan/xylan/chitin deacetylase (PgdA/CDA1 family)